MKFKIGIVTIILVFLVLFFISQAYSSKQLYNVNNDLCDMLYGDMSDFEINSIEDEVEYQGWIDCIYDSNSFFRDFFNKIYLSIIFIFLAILSWRFDQLERKNKKRKKKNN